MAKNKKAGLGRGLNSLLGGYEAPAEPARVVPERQVERTEFAHCGERCGSEDGAHRRARWRNH